MSPRGKPPWAGIHCAELSLPVRFLEMKGKLPANTEIPTDFLTSFGHSLHYPQRSIWNENYFIFRTPVLRQSCSEVTSPMEASLLGEVYQLWSQMTQVKVSVWALVQKHWEGRICVPYVPVPGQCQAHSRSSINMC